MLPPCGNANADTALFAPAPFLMPMQVAGLQPRHALPSFVNHTPRLDIFAPDPSPEISTKPGPAAMVLGAGTLYTSAIMGQAPSAVERENARKASSTILREDSILIEESENTDRPDSWSMHYDCTNQAPYSTNAENSTMMTQNSLLVLPKANPSHDLAFFLRTTGPTAPHRRPTKIDSARRTASRPKNAARFLKTRQKRSEPCLKDEGGLLLQTLEPIVPTVVQQKVSLNGTE